MERKGNKITKTKLKKRKSERNHYNFKIYTQLE